MVLSTVRSASKRYLRETRLWPTEIDSCIQIYNKISRDKVFWVGCCCRCFVFCLFCLFFILFFLTHTKANLISHKLNNNSNTNNKNNNNNNNKQPCTVTMVSYTCVVTLYGVIDGVVIYVCVCVCERERERFSNTLTNYERLIMVIYLFSGIPRVRNH